MNAWVLAVALLAPVTQEEALDFHAKGRCEMSSPGTGLTRPDGKGYIVSSLPGPHLIVAGGKAYTLDMTPGKAYPIKAPGGNVAWCPKFVPSGREDCGQVPPAFLFNSVTVR